MRLFYIPVFFCLLWVLGSCKKNITPALPGKGASIKVNYFTNSDVLSQYPMGGVGIFVDTVVHKNKGNFPFFNISGSPAQLEYPKFFSAGPGLLYINYLAGQHHFQFNYMVPDTTTSKLGSVPNAALIDTSLMLNANSETLIYLIDGPVKTENTDPMFKLLTIPANRALKIDSTMVAVVIAHQSPDSGPLSCKRIKPDGSFSTEKLPQSLPYGQYTEYLLFNVKEASNGIIGFRIYNSLTGEEVINTGLPANGGHAYVLSLLGFQHDHSMRLPVSLNQDKTVQYGNTIVAANLRGSLRQIW